MISSEDEHWQEASSSRHLLGALEDLLQRSDPSSSSERKRRRYQSKSLDDLLLYRLDKCSTNNQRADLTHTELNLSALADEGDDCHAFSLQRSRSAPVSPSEIYEKELAAFVDCDPTQSAAHPTDNFVYNVDLSDSPETPHPTSSKLALFFDDDYTAEEINYEPTVTLLLPSSHLHNCLTIEEENEEELEQLRRADEQEQAQQKAITAEEKEEEEYAHPIPVPSIVLSNDNDTIENEDMTQMFEPPEHHADRLSTIYEAPSPQAELNDSASDKLVVYDFEKTYPFPVIHSPIIPSQSSPILYPIERNPQLSSSHVQKMRVIQSTSSSLSDFISSSTISTFQHLTNYKGTSSVVHRSLTNCSSLEPSERRPSLTRGILTNGLLLSHCASNPIPRRKPPAMLSESSTSSEGLFSSDENLLSRSDFLLPHERTTSPRRRSTSLKILYPIDFPVPPSDSGIVLEDLDSAQLKQYRKNLTELSLLKKNLVDIESRLTEAVREEQLEQALIEGEHELVFKQILEASELDQQHLRQLYQNLQGLLERVMTDKAALRDEIDYTQQILRQSERELRELEQKYRSSDERISRKKEAIRLTRQKYDDFEFQLMELETRCEAELEQAERQFQHEQQLVAQNAQLRQATLRELDQQQNVIFEQASREKEKLEREKRALKTVFKQKKNEIQRFEERIHREDYPATSLPKEEPAEEMMHLNKISFLEQRFQERMASPEAQVKLREKNRLQERPLTRYLPIRSVDFDLRAHIESAGHQLDSLYVTITPTSCRGYLYKMGGMKFKTWNRRWFVFDRQCRSLAYYQEKNERKLRGTVSFQSILEVYVDHLQAISLRPPEPREATFIVKASGRSYYLVAPTVEAMRIWIDVLITGAEGNTFARN